MRAVLSLAALVTAAGAGAQTLTLNVNQNTTVSVAKDDCTVPLTVNWTLSATGLSGCSDHSDLVIWVTKNSSCGTDPAAGDTTVGTVPQSTWTSTASGSFTLDVMDLPVFAGTTCPVIDLEQVMKVCGYVKTLQVLGSTCQEVKPATVPTITYDSKPPAAPTITGVVPQDGALLINFTAATDAVSVLVAYADAVGPYNNGPTGPAATGAIRLEGLTNGVTYAVLLRAEDAAGNKSDPSEAVTGIPVPSDGFFATYRGKGGDTTGCAAAPAGALPLLALGWLSWRRRHGRGGGRS